VIFKTPFRNVDFFTSLENVVHRGVLSY
jgi:hypothetical protein